MANDREHELQEFERTEEDEGNGMSRKNIGNGNREFTNKQMVDKSVVVKKRFLGHHQKFEKVPLKSADKNKF